MKFLEWLDKRLLFRQRHRNFLERDIPDNLNYSYCLGGISFTFFIFLVISGLLLSLYYIPHEKSAYQSIVVINEEMVFGRIIRGVHKWSATLYIIFILLHSLRVFITRSYLPPRDLNWITGAFTMLFSMASGFTGYLLPWDQKAYWATEVGTSIFKTIPFIGDEIVYLIRGGEKVSGITLTRFYAVHVLYLPLIIGCLLWGHFHMVKRLGIAKRL